MASKRVLAEIQRSGKGAHLTDTTPVVVWSHEIPILAEIHGNEPALLDDYEVLVDKAITKAEEPDPADKSRKVVVLRDELVKRRVKELALGTIFDGSPEDEYQRLETVYGMHPEVKMSYVEKVYGHFREGRFVDAVTAKARKAA